MSNTVISYQSFCWVVGTTSFRTAKLNLKIEEQLLLLDEFYREISKKSQWEWCSTIQEQYYNFMKDKGFVTGEANLKEKEAREKTSGLVELGLVTADRIITEAGRTLIDVTNTVAF